MDSPRLLSLLADDRGNAIVEAAIVAPFLALLVVGASDLSQAFGKKIKVQQAATRSIELATASGYNGSAFSQLQSDAATAAGVPASQVIVDKWLECSGVRQSTINDVCGTGQLPARYVSISVFDTYQPFFSAALKYARANNNGTLNLSGYAAVRIQ